MNKNKILTAVMAGTMMMGSVLPVCAAVTDYDPISQEAVGEDGTSRDTEVLYNLGSTFSVVIPKTIVLDAVSKDSDYAVRVYGDISSDKKVTVAPQDALTDIEGINFYMIDQATAGTKKANVQADVTQDVVDWTSAEVIADTSKDGNVAAPTITAGNWKGTFNFNIALADAE
ncbi:MAG: hypothetical protein OSJ61_08615 [Lachnospiraceae bacterium]|nr:hypothetical protein [Lachnospiraceae bacterium]